MKRIEEIETLLELADNEVPVNYNSLINTFNNDKFEISYVNKEYTKRYINRNGIYTSMLQIRINETNKMIVILMVHYNNHNYRHDIDKNGICKISIGRKHVFSDPQNHGM